MPLRPNPSRIIPLQYERRGTQHGDPKRFIPLLLILAVLTAFGILCRADFTNWDDNETLAFNPDMNPPSVRHLLHCWRKPKMELYVPVTYTVWSALAMAAQHGLPNDLGSPLQPTVFHAANVLLHALSVLVVFAILRLLFRMDWPACGGALFFALHPVQVEPVAWASGLKDLLCGLLTLTAVWQYLRYAILVPVKFPTGERWTPAAAEEARHPWLEPRQLHWALATAAFVAAMLAKPTAVAAPLICFALDYWILRRQFGRILKSLVPWLVLTIPFVLICVKVQVAQSFADYGNPLFRPLVAGDALLFYLGKLIAPIHLAVDYGRQPAIMLSHHWIYFAWIVPLALACWIIARRRKRPWLVAASFVFVAPLLPVLGFKPFLMQSISTTADHYLYLAMLGPAVALASVLTRHRRISVAIACAILFATYTALCIQQSRVWMHDQTLWTHTLEVNPNSFVALIHLGHDDERQGDYKAACDKFELAVKINPNFPMAQANLAKEQITQKNWDQMEAHGQALMALMHHRPLSAQQIFASDYALFGRQFVYQHQPQRALPFLHEALRLDPACQDARETLRKAQGP